MPTPDLNQAIQLIQQGQPQQAQPILQALIWANRQDLTAWSWYAKSCTTPEKRLEALQMCLKFNPGNPQVQEAIQKIQAKLLTAQPTAAFTSVPSVFQYAEDSPTGPDAGQYTNPYPDPYAALAIPANAGAAEAVVDAPAVFIGLDEIPGRPFVWYDVWFRALTQANVDTYTALLRDPLASPGRAYWWVFMATIITGLVSLLNPVVLGSMSQFDQVKGGPDIGVIIAVVLVVLVPVGAGLSVLGLMFGVAISNLLAKLLGGSGNFSRTVYLVGAYAAPFSIITGILSIIPFVSCLTLPLSFYSFWLNVTAIQAAHRLNGGRATIVVLIPSLLIFMLLCIAFAVGGQAFLDALRHFPKQPVY